MIMKIYVIVIALVFTSLVSRGQELIKITAKVDSFFSINYYVVIKAHNADRKFTILSKTYEKNGLTKYRYSCLIRKGKRYTFILQQTSVIKVSTDANMLINLRSFNIGDRHFLDNGELPYMALNMFNTRLFK